MTKEKIELKFVKICPLIKMAPKQKNSDLLAYASLKIFDQKGRFLILGGFTVRKSKYDGNPYITFPSCQNQNKKIFKFISCEKELEEEIKKMILDAYEYATIPIVDE